MRERLRITVRGAVQGVGFRPYVHGLATHLALDGFVRNRGAAVEIEAEGEDPRRLFRALDTAALPGAIIEQIGCETIAPQSTAGFRIAPSMPDRASTPQALPDRVCCTACLRDVFDPDSRFYRYPFTSCSHCGPRYSIQIAAPYDRARTTMAPFAMCEACRADYDNPASRRFHAQPIACPTCGPSLRFRLADSGGAGSHEPPLDQESALRAAVALIARGGILALKGIGGYQLLADAGNADAIARLRARKSRPAKPFAVMVRDLEMARRFCQVSAAEAALLTSAAGPIVLLERGSGALPGVIAPELDTLGLLLPTTPLHHLLLADLSGPVICTSGNVASEPIAVDDADARCRLAGIADGWLQHDRRIRRPLDDSVARVIDGAPQWLRIGRGHAPLTLASRPGATVLGCGGQLKNTLALAADSRVIVSQHFGDLDDARCLDAMLAGAADLQAFHECDPLMRAIDAHPDCTAATAGPGRQLPAVTVPHHLAHALAAMLEHDLDGPLLAVVWDGNGLGSDGSLWGGEILQVERRPGIRWRRAAHLRAVPLAGGDAAARDPGRALAGFLWSIPELRSRVPADARALLERQLHSPYTTSVGRLFDAVAALAGFTDRQRYEGEAACRLEHAARGKCAEPYHLLAVDNELDWRPLIRAVVRDHDAGVCAAMISARFHAALAAAIVTQARSFALETVILTGGCFQNRLLTTAACVGLRAAGFTPVLARRLPPNDGGLAAGQVCAAIAGSIEEVRL